MGKSYKHNPYNGDNKTNKKKFKKNNYKRNRRKTKNKLSNYIEDEEDYIGDKK